MEFYIIRQTGFTSNLMKDLRRKEALEKAGLAENIIKIELYDADRNGYDVTLDVKSSDILRICRDLYESGVVTCAEPSCFMEIKHGAGNAHYLNQWGLKNTGQSGATSGIDINAEQAWAITRGSSGIKIAVIDEGVDLTHPDLQGNLLPGYDATVNPPGGANGSPWANNAHGTACAGIVGAINNAIGVVGVASGCKIVPIRIAYDRYDDGNWTTNETWISNGIDHAWRTAKVDVLNNSWSCSSSYTKVQEAIYYATTNGRGYKGCVVVVCTQNWNSSTVSYPASLSNVIAVGAISYNGMRKSPTTPDGETWWGSNYGTALDVVAPGVKIYTTDIQSSLGDNTTTGTAGNYYASFNGTSAATPHVAGIAALILSANPNLTQKQVSDIIESTAEKVGGYGYTTTSGRPNGMWNNQMGYGLVDAYAALSSTDINIPEISLELIRQSNYSVYAVFSVDNPQSGVPYYQWELNGSILSSVYTPYIAFQSGSDSQMATQFATLRCRAVFNGIHSAWSNSIYHFVWSLAPVYYTPGI
ncbi:MAG: S8 family serine peptidase [Tannerellaceae bacterium]|jgi:subtilisin family serine protease|nr:S8 family serine peptidase [Tannerellaceae bacterium]